MDNNNTLIKNLLLLLPPLCLCLFSSIRPCTCCCSFPDRNGTANALIQGMFVFGSSLVDNGNNNFLQNLAKADYLPYGVDFPYGPSGRFTNGKNVIDLLGDQLKLPCFLPVFADPSTKGSKIVHGVNFASGGSGILDDTGSITGRVFSLSQQIKNFEEVTVPELEAQLGCRSSESLPNYLFVVGTGGNDYSFNYFLKKPNNISLEAFTANLTISLHSKLKKLYSLGARKYVLMSLNPLGCSPGVLAAAPTNQGCLRGLNRAAWQFNSHLKSLVDRLGLQMPGAKLVFVNQYKIISDIIKDPVSKGFKDTTNSCCEVASLGGGILCQKLGSTCADRNGHVFFDGLHPTEAVNVEIARKAFASILMSEVYPINVQQLVKL